MACSEQRREQIAAFAAGRLDPGSAQGLLEHLAECGVCSAEFDLVADLIACAPVAGGRKRPWLPAAALLAAALLVGLWLARPWAGGELADLADITPVAAPPGQLRGPGEDARGAGYAAAMAAYRAGDWAEAAAGLAAVGSNRPEDPLVHLYLGICRLQIGRIEAAVPALRVAAERGAGLVGERGKWYLANALLLLDQAEPARDLLQQLVDEATDYAANAAALLQALADR